MSDTIEEIFGPDAESNKKYYNIDELASSRTKAATTASQTIDLARQLIAEHNSDINAHESYSVKLATTDTAGIVKIEDDLVNNPNTDSYTVPNTTAIINYVDDILTSAIKYSGTISISEISVDEKGNIILPLSGSIKQGSMYILSGDGTVKYKDTVYSAEDFIIARKKISANDQKTANLFDWFNIQDRDIVKLAANQTLTNKNLVSGTNVYRPATSSLDGAVKIATAYTGSEFNLSENVVPNVSYVNHALQRKLSVTEFSYGSEFRTFTPISNVDPRKQFYPEVESVVNLESFIEYNDDGLIKRIISLPNEHSEPEIDVTEYLVTKSYVDDKVNKIEIVFEENKPVATPIITNGYLRKYMADGSYITEIDNVNSNVDIEDGYKIYWRGKWKWEQTYATEADGTLEAEYSIPTQWQGQNFGYTINNVDFNNVPSAGTVWAAGEMTLGSATSPLTTNKTGTITTKSPKTGLIIENGNIVKADSSTPPNTASDSIAIAFYRNVYWGYYKGSSLPYSNDPAENYKFITGIDFEGDNEFYSYNLKHKTFSFSNLKINYEGQRPKPNVSDSEFNNYYFYLIYPNTIGELNVVKDANGLTSTGFTDVPQNSMTIVNPDSRKEIILRVYRFINPGVVGPWTVVSTK